MQLFVWPGVTAESLFAKPFHIYDDEFYDVIGSNPSLTTIASSESDPIFHEAVTWYVSKKKPSNPAETNHTERSGILRLMRFFSSRMLELQQPAPG